MSCMERLNSNFLEKIILKGMLSDRDFLILVSSVFEENYFDDPNIAHSFKFCKDYANQYHRIPDRDAIINSSENPADIREVINEAVETDFDVANSYEFLLNQSNDYLKEKALKRAIIDSVDDVEDPERRNDIQKRIENALIKDIKVDLGLKYFEQLGVRLRRIFTTSENRIPTYFPLFDELINGGFPPYTFNVLTAKIHGGKCLEKNTLISVKNCDTNDIENTRIKDFFDRFSTKHKYNKKEIIEMLSLDGMVEKYGKEEGNRRYYEWKEKISKSSKNRNTLDFFIKKYGKEEGTKRHNQYLEKQKESHSLNGYIKKYGKEEGTKKWNDLLKKTTNNTLDYYVKKYGKEEGTKKWNDRKIKWQNTLNSKSPEEINEINKKKSGSLENYIRKYGEKDGIDKWLKKNKKNSESSRKIDVDKIDEFQKYKIEVMRISNNSIKKYGLENEELRSREYHLDHKVSIAYGFNNNIPEYVIGSIYNLEIITVSENTSKKDKCSMDCNELIKHVEGDDFYKKYEN